MNRVGWNAADHYHPPFTIGPEVWDICLREPSTPGYLRVAIHVGPCSPSALVIGKYNMVAGFAVCTLQHHRIIEKAPWCQQHAPGPYAPVERGNNVEILN